MIPQGFGYHQRHSDHHWMLGLAAVLLSVVVHVVVMYFFADWTLLGATRLAQRGREWFLDDRAPPMRVETMRADPMRLAQRIAGERDAPSRGPIEVSELVETLSQETSPALTAPPPIPREALIPGMPSLKESLVEKIDATPWMPRQEIAQIFDRTVQDAVATLPRREIPMVERIPHAPDIVPSIDLAGRRFGRDPEPPKPIEAAEVFDTEIRIGTFLPPVVPAVAMSGQISAETTESRFALQPGERRAPTTGQSAGDADAGAVKPIESPDAPGPVMPSPTDEIERQAREAQARIAALRETVEYLPIDDLLAVGIEIYREPREPDRVYFRIGIQLRADRNVPVIPKDIVWVQDASASIGEDRMIQCRRALQAALDTLNPEDRFEVMAFRNTAEFCFNGWAAPTDENRARAARFISNLRSFGSTDILGSLKTLLTLKRDPLRPMIAFVVTDGLPTEGITDSSRIIGDFTQLNNGMMSVYMFGTQRRANAYLMDMLTYSNRGRASVLQGNRWEIPAGMAELYEGVRNPVLGDVAVTFDAASRSEVYPRNVANLYLSRQMELVGISPADTDELIFQIRGLAAGKGYDSIFRLSLSRHARLGAPAIRDLWAQQKMYHLVSAYSRDPRQELLAEMLKLSSQFGIPVPHKSELR